MCSAFGDKLPRTVKSELDDRPSTILVVNPSHGPDGGPYPRDCVTSRIGGNPLPRTADPAAHEVLWAVAMTPSTSRHAVLGFESRQGHSAPSRTPSAAREASGTASGKLRDPLGDERDPLGVHHAPTDLGHRRSGRCGGHPVDHCRAPGVPGFDLPRTSAGAGPRPAGRLADPEVVG